MFSKEFIQKVKDATNLRELIEEYTELTRSSSNVWIGRCPHPDHNDSTPSFRYYSDGNNGAGSFMCFGCQDVYARRDSDSFIGSDAIAFIQWITNTKKQKGLSFPAAVEFLAKKAGIPLKETTEDSKWGLLYQRNRSFANRCHQNLLPQVKSYLYSRGLEDRDCDLWNIGAAPFEEEDGTTLRVVMPLIDERKRVIAFCNRAINKTGYGIKYRNSHNSEIFKKREYLFGHQFLKKKYPYVYITEGQFDVILAHKYGLTNVVATLGSHLSDEQCEKIKSLKLIPVMIYDGDDAGLQGIRSAVKMCRKHKLYCKVCVLPKDKDLAELALEIKTDIFSWVETHTVPAWQFLLSEPLIKYEAALQQMREQMLPLIQDALGDSLTFEEKVLARTFIQEKFGILM